MAQESSRSQSPEASAAESSPPPAKANSSSKKRKTILPELEVDLSQPEPPSKKAKRALKKGKPLTSTNNRSDDDDDLNPQGSDNEDGDKDGKKKGSKKERSQFGIWIGNLPFTITRAELFRWFVDNSGGAIAEDSITRVNLPLSKDKNRPPARRPSDAEADKGGKAPAQNKGFAYVDFATYEACIAAIALSETEINGRKVLIKDAKSFEGRPKAEPQPGAADATQAPGGKNGVAASAVDPAARKIFVGNLGFATTEDDLRHHFGKCGEIDWVKVATFEDTGKCKGYGWVKFRVADAAAWAVKGFVKIKEEELTEDDFLDDEDKPAAADDGEDADADADGEKKPERKVKLRKWWVNTLRGRPLKIQIAEDDQVRYKKRFGKDASARNKDGKERTGAAAAGEDGQRAPRERKAPAKLQKVDDINVARLTGAAVAPQGKKVTFD